MIGFQGLSDPLHKRRGDETGYIAAELGHLPHHGGADMAVFGSCCKEKGFCLVGIFYKQKEVAEATSFHCFLLTLREPKQIRKS